MRQSQLATVLTRSKPSSAIVIGRRACVRERHKRCQLGVTWPNIHPNF